MRAPRSALGKLAIGQLAGVLALTNQEMAESGEKRPLGFDALVDAGDEEGAGYTVKFSSTDRESPEAAQEEINLIDRQGGSPEEEAAEKVSQRAEIAPKQLVSFPPVSLETFVHIVIFFRATLIKSATT